MITESVNKKKQRVFPSNQGPKNNFMGLNASLRMAVVIGLAWRNQKKYKKTRQQDGLAPDHLLPCQPGMMLKRNYFFLSPPLREITFAVIDSCNWINSASAITVLVLIKKFNELCISLRTLNISSGYQDRDIAKRRTKYQRIPSATIVLLLVC